MIAISKDVHDYVNCERRRQVKLWTLYTVAGVVQLLLMVWLIPEIVIEHGLWVGRGMCLLLVAVAWCVGGLHTLRWTVKNKMKGWRG